MPVIAWMKNEQFITVTGVTDGHKICNTKRVHLNNITSDHEGCVKLFDHTIISSFFFKELACNERLGI